MRRKISVIINLLIAVIVPVAWGLMMFRVEGGPLSTHGIGSLRYFTVLSNLLCGLSAVIYLVNTKMESRQPESRVTALKFVSAAAVGLTFSTVLFLFILVYRLPLQSMYSGSSFFFHLIVPLAAIADVCFFDNCHALRFRDTFKALIPPVVYAIGYVANLLVNGVEGNDFYGFVQPTIIGSALMGLTVIFTAWLVAVIMWAISLPMKKAKREKVTV